jgi:hypothetical protein
VLSFIAAKESVAPCSLFEGCILLIFPHYLAVRLEFSGTSGSTLDISSSFYQLSPSSLQCRHKDELYS